MKLLEQLEKRYKQLRAEQTLLDIAEDPDVIGDFLGERSIHIVIDLPGGIRRHRLVRPEVVEVQEMLREAAGFLGVKE